MRGSSVEAAIVAPIARGPWDGVLAAPARPSLGGRDLPQQLADGAEVDRAVDPECVVMSALHLDEAASALGRRRRAGGPARVGMIVSSGEWRKSFGMPIEPMRSIEGNR